MAVELATWLIIVIGCAGGLVIFAAGSVIILVVIRYNRLRRQDQTGLPCQHSIQYRGANHQITHSQGEEIPFPPSLKHRSWLKPYGYGRVHSREALQSEGSVSSNKDLAHSPEKSVLGDEVLLPQKPRNMSFTRNKLVKAHGYPKMSPVMERQSSDATSSRLMGLDGGTIPPLRWSTVNKLDSLQKPAPAHLERRSMSSMAMFSMERVGHQPPDYKTIPQPRSILKVQRSRSLHFQPMSSPPSSCMPSPLAAARRSASFMTNSDITRLRLRNSVDSGSSVTTEELLGLTRPGSPNLSTKAVNNTGDDEDEEGEGDILQELARTDNRVSHPYLIKSPGRPPLKQEHSFQASIRSYRLSRNNNGLQISLVGRSNGVSRRNSTSDNVENTEMDIFSSSDNEVSTGQGFIRELSSLQIGSRPKARASLIEIGTRRSLVLNETSGNQSKLEQARKTAEPMAKENVNNIRWLPALTVDLPSDAKTFADSQESALQKHSIVFAEPVTPESYRISQAKKAHRVSAVADEESDNTDTEFTPGRFPQPPGDAALTQKATASSPEKSAPNSGSSYSATLSLCNVYSEDAAKIDCVKRAPEESPTKKPQSRRSLQKLKTFSQIPNWPLSLAASAGTKPAGSKDVSETSTRDASKDGVLKMSTSKVALVAPIALRPVAKEDAPRQLPPPPNSQESTARVVKGPRAQPEQRRKSKTRSPLRSRGPNRLSHSPLRNVVVPTPTPSPPAESTEVTEPIEKLPSPGSILLSQIQLLRKANSQVALLGRDQRRQYLSIGNSELLDGSISEEEHEMQDLTSRQLRFSAIGTRGSDHKLSPIGKEMQERARRGDDQTLSVSSAEGILGTGTGMGALGTSPSMSTKTRSIWNEEVF